MRYYLSLAWAFFQQQIKIHMTYRLNFFISLTSTVTWQTATLAAVWVVLDRAPVLGTWRREETFLIYGLITVAGAISRTFAFNLFFLGGMYIRPGTFDRFLLRPVNPLFALLTERLSPEGMGDLIVGAALVARSFAALGLAPTSGRIAYLILAVCSGALIIIALNLATASTAFWIVEATPLMLALNHNTQVARYPLEIFSKPLRLILTWVVPYGLASFYPAEFLLGRATGPMAFAALPVGCLLFALAYQIWLRGLRHYSGTGS
ncbi:MAG: hypothetical protein K0R39_3037 [Symbiobacteriaceae bacterium]|jgi:ABC-2 type transport system permease protein|nr:hypothetical protein [Symbiobacteriaceae bacterium]